MNTFFLSNILLAPAVLLMLIVGTLALSSHRARADNRAFFLQNCLGAFHAAATANLYFGDPINPQDLAHLLEVVGLGWLWALATFTYAFPTGRTPPLKYWLPLTLLTILAMALRLDTSHALSAPALTLAGTSLIAFSVISVSGAHKRALDHLQTRGIFLVQIITFIRLILAVGTHLYPNELPQWLLILEIYIAPLVICAVFGFVLWRYQLLDIRLLLTRTVSLFAVGGVTASIIVLAIEVLQWLFRLMSLDPYGQSTLVAPGLIVLLLMVFNPLKAKFETWIEGMVNRGLARAKESTGTYYRQTEGVLDVPQLLKALDETIAEIFPAASASIALSQPTPILLATPSFKMPEGQIDGGAADNPQAKYPFAGGLAPLTELYDDWKKPCILSFAEPEDPKLDPFRALKADVVVPFLVAQANYGALILRAPVFDKARLQLLPPLARHLGLQLTSALLYQDALDANANLMAANRELADTRLFLEAIIDGMPVGLAVIDETGRIKRWTPKMTQLTGLASGHVMAAETLPTAILELGDLDTVGKGPIRRQFQIQEDGHAIDKEVNIRVARLGDHLGLHRGYILLFSDVTEITRLQRDLEHSRQLAALGQLAAAMAHEIRTPLTSIKLNVQILSSQLELNDDDAEYFDIILQELDRLNQYVTEILDYARPVKLNRQDTDMVELIDEVRRSLYFLLAERETELVIENESAPHLQVDGERLKQIFINLIDNASQAMEGHTPGEIRVSLTPAYDQGRPGLAIAIADKGMGMDEKTCASVFTPFFTTKATGTGLGLAIAQKVAQSHQGHIRAESRPGEGSTFTLWLPET